MLFEDIWRIISNKDLMSYVFKGFGNTLLITLLAAAMGLVIGLVVAMVKIAAED